MLTEKQKEEAEWLYIQARLSQDDLDTYNSVVKINKEIERLKTHILELQKTCSHPLIARNHTNKGYSYNDSSSYWTDHECCVCTFQWTTSCDWEYVGTKLGLPSDKEAKKW